MYRAIVGFLDLCLAVFYDRRRAGDVGVPANGPLVLVGNHPNGLVDPVLVAGTTRRRLRFLAKEPLFRMPVIGLAVRGAGALPVARVRDGGAGDRNEEMFSAVAAALHAGDAVALFPEGTTHDGSELTELRTGAARMVLSAEAAHGFGLGVQVVPVGLTYEDKARFRSTVTTEVGATVTAADLAERYAEDPRAAARELTVRIEAALRTVTLNLDTWADLGPVRLAAQLVDRAEPVRGARRIGAQLAAAYDSGPEGRARADRVRARLTDLDDRLRDLRVPADQLDGEYAVGGVIAFVLRNLAALVLGVPVALAGTVFYVAPYELHRLLVGLVRPTQVLAATVKVVAGIVVFGAWQAALTLLLVELLGGWSVLLVWLLLPAAGVYAARYLSRRGRALGRARQFVRSVIHPSDRLAAVRAERDGVLADLAELEAMAPGRPPTRP